MTFNGVIVPRSGGENRNLLSITIRAIYLANQLTKFQLPLYRIRRPIDVIYVPHFKRTNGRRSQRTESWETNKTAAKPIRLNPPYLPTNSNKSIKEFFPVPSNWTGRCTLDNER